jgi:hypothetical protein
MGLGGAAKPQSRMYSLSTLRRFDLEIPVVLSVDAPPTGIGAVLLQDGQPVACSSTSLIQTQQRYCQIEKELIAVQFGLLRFWQYVYGRQAKVESDHKPLEGFWLSQWLIVLLESNVCDSSSNVLISGWSTN